MFDIADSGTKRLSHVILSLNFICFLTSCVLVEKVTTSKLQDGKHCMSMYEISDSVHAKAIPIRHNVPFQ